MLNKNLEYLLKEYCEPPTRTNRQILLALDEADQNQVLNSLTSKLYDLIIDKVDDIDYGTIPNSKGDITQIENYDQLLECIDVITGMLKEYNQKTDSIDTIKTALNNIVDRKDSFEKGFRYNIEFVMVTYCTLTLSVISATSFLITTCIDFIKEPNSDSFEASIDKTALAKSKDNLLFLNLQKFNHSVSKGEFDKAIDYLISSNVKQLSGVTAGYIVGGVALTIIALNIIPIIRELIFFFYYSRTKISDYFEIQAQLLEINAYNVQNNITIDKNKKKEIYRKQTKIAAIFRSISNKFAVKMKKGEIEVEKEKKNNKTNKPLKADDLVSKDSLPDSVASQVASGSSLF